MRKSELLSLEILRPTKDMIEAARNDKSVQEKALYSNYTRLVYKYSRYFRAKVFGDILKVAVFTRDDILRNEPIYEIFISNTENKYLTYNLIEKKWKNAKIDNLGYCGGFYKPQERYYAKGSEKVITDYIDNEYKRGYEAIYQFQSKIKEDELKRKHRKITEKIDSEMELVPELPKDFNKWIDNKAMIHSRYIYYLYSRNVKEGFCTHCGNMVPIINPKHNTEGTCKHCKSKIIYKAIKKAKTVLDEGYASIMQKTKEGYVLRYFEIRKTYKDYKNPELNVDELVRVLYDKNFLNTGTYEWGEFKNTGVYRWCTWEDKPYSYSNYRNFKTYIQPSTVYEKNLNKIFKGTKYQYCAVEKFVKGLKGERFYLAEYLKEYGKHKYIEYLVKIGLYRLVKDNLKGYDTNEINHYGKRPHEVLKVRPDQVKMLCDMNANTDELRVLQKANAAGVRLNKEQIRWIAKNLGRSNLIDYMKYSTAHKFIRYLKEQSNGKNINTLSHDYSDYIECSEKLGYDISNPFILYPKHLKESHDQVTNEWQQYKDRIEEMNENERNIEMGYIAEELVKLYGMKDKHFCIRIPWTCEEIKKEGHTLHHCVGTYVDKVLRKETIILFIRKKEDIEKPFYTMEIKNHEIAQVRGKHNCNMTPEVKAFVEKFKNKKLQDEFMRKVD